MEKHCNCFRFPLKAVKVMHTVALRNESSVQSGVSYPSQLSSHEVCAWLKNKAVLEFCFICCRDLLLYFMDN